MSEDLGRTKEPGGAPDGAEPTRTPRAPGRLRRAAAAVPAVVLLGGCAVLGAGGGAAYGLLTPPAYTATAYVLAVPGKGGDTASALGFAQAYGRVATQVAVLGDAQVDAGVPVAKLRSSVTAETSPDAPMVAITASAARPGQARDTANAVSRALVTAATHSADATRVKLLSFSRAVAPSSPATPGPLLTTLVGACAGGLLGALGLLVRPRRAAGEAAAPAGSVPGPAKAPAQAEPAAAGAEPGATRGGGTAGR